MGGMPLGAEASNHGALGASRQRGSRSGGTGSPKTGVPTVCYRRSESNCKPRRSRRTPPRSAEKGFSDTQNTQSLCAHHHNMHRQREKRGQLIERSGIREPEADAANCDTRACQAWDDRGRGIACPRFVKKIEWSNGGIIILGRGCWRKPPTQSSDAPNYRDGVARRHRGRVNGQMRLSAFLRHCRLLSVAALGAMLAFPASAQTGSDFQTPSTGTSSSSEYSNSNHRHTQLQLPNSKHRHTGPQDHSSHWVRLLALIRRSRRLIRRPRPYSPTSQRFPIFLSQ